MFSGQPLDCLARAAGVDEILTALMGMCPQGSADGMGQGWDFWGECMGNAEGIY